MIFDRINRCFLRGTYKTAKRARDRANKLDLIYGACRYSVKTMDDKEV